MLVIKDDRVKNQKQGSIFGGSVYGQFYLQNSPYDSLLSGRWIGG